MYADTHIESNREGEGLLPRHLLQIVTIFHGNIAVINLWIRFELVKKTNNQNSTIIAEK